MATSQYYAIGPANSWVQAVGGSTAGNGYVVGGDGTNYDGFVWSENGNHVHADSRPRRGAGNLQQRSTRGRLDPGQQPQCGGLQHLSGTLDGTYWAGEATGVNNNGLVIGDNSNDVYNEHRGVDNARRWLISPATVR